MDPLLLAVDTWTRQLSRGAEVELALVWHGTGDPKRYSSNGALPPCCLAVGSPTTVRLTPRDVFGSAVAAGADWVVIAHTHISDSGPSDVDHAVTRRLVAAGVVLGIPLLAHLLVEPSSWQELVAGGVAVRSDASAA